MRKSILAGALMVAAACSGSSNGGPTPPGVVTSVAVTATPTEITVNGTAQASALVKDQNGNTLGGKTVTWSSLNPGVASVTQSGVITGVTAGSATIQGAVEGVSGSATVVVISSVSACNTGLTVVDLAVGGVSVLSSTATKGCIKVPAATSAAADYLVIAANLNTPPADQTAGVLGDYVIKSDEGETVPSTNRIPSNSVFSATGGAPGAAIGDLGAAQIGFETRLRMEERRLLRLPDAQRAHRSRHATAQQRYSVSSAIPVVGERTTFKVPMQMNPCTNFVTITAEVQYINARTIIYSDVVSPSGGFTAAEYQQIGDEFADLIYPTDVSYFGTPLDEDNNGGRIILLYTPEVNKFTPAGSTSFVGGFFFAGDLFPSTGAGSCGQSNIAEMLYLLSPDPSGTINNNTRTTTSVRQGTRGTIAHEFQHMINSSERIRSPILQNFEHVWLDEGLSHFAEDAVGRVVRGIGEAEDADFSRTFGGSANDFNAFFFQNLARFKVWLQNPGPVGPTSSNADSSLAVRGAAWALLRYTADQYAPGGDIKAYTRKLAGGPDTGFVNLSRNAGNVAFNTLITGWMIANYADNLGIPGLPPLYSYKSYDMRSNEASISNNNYPLKVNNITGSGFALTGLQARQGSGNYFFTPQRNAGAPARTFRFLNPDAATAASFTDANWIVVRTR